MSMQVEIKPYGRPDDVVSINYILVCMVFFVLYQPLHVIRYKEVPQLYIKPIRGSGNIAGYYPVSLLPKIFPVKRVPLLMIL